VIIDCEIRRFIFVKNVLVKIKRSFNIIKETKHYSILFHTSDINCRVRTPTIRYNNNKYSSCNNTLYYVTLFRINRFKVRKKKNEVYKYIFYFPFQQLYYDN